MIQMLDDIDMVTKAYGIFFKKIGQWNDKTMAQVRNKHRM